jgi:hypothetical protein
LWRDTQRELAAAITRTNETIERLAQESATADKRLEARIDQLAAVGEEGRRLAERLEALIYAVGKIISMRASRRKSLAALAWYFDRQISFQRPLPYSRGSVRDNRTAHETSVR